MKLSADESRALGFVALVLVLAAVARWVGREPDPLADEAVLDLATLESASARAEQAEARRQRPLEPGEKIDPNTAPADELERLPRIGPALAERIVADRKQNGAFRSLTDLGRVTGIGERTLELLAPHLAIARASNVMWPSTRAWSEGAWSSNGGWPSSETGAASNTGSGSDPWPSDGAWPRPPRASGTAPREPGAVERSSRTDVAGRSGRAGFARAPPSPEAPLDLNAADAAALERLPGIGPVLASRIVAFRDSVDGFGTLDELDRVPGIGPATLARLAPLLQLGR